MANKEELAAGSAVRKWTRIDSYLRPMRRRSAARRRLSARLSSEREHSPALLSTLPFVALALGLALITLIIVTLAWPGHFREKTRPMAKPLTVERGTAPPGWIDG